MGDFTITFWIRTADNSGWGNPDTEIDFPRLLVDDYVVFSSKIRTRLKITILHPSFGHRKLFADISGCIGKDVHIAIVGGSKSTHLYINSNQVSAVESSKTQDNLEAGDFVLVGDRSTIARVNRVAGSNRVYVYYLGDSAPTGSSEGTDTHHVKLSKVYGDLDQDRQFLNPATRRIETRARLALNYTWGLLIVTIAMTILLPFATRNSSQLITMLIMISVTMLAGLKPLISLLFPGPSIDRSSIISSQKQNYKHLAHGNNPHHYADAHK